MNRRQAADVERWAAQDAAGDCGLCGGTVAVVWNGTEHVAFEVCADCNRAFQDLAEALHVAQIRRQARQELVAEVQDQVAGQLDLDELVDSLHAERAAGYYR